MSAYNETSLVAATTADDISRLKAILDWADEQSNGSCTVTSAKEALDRLAKEIALLRAAVAASSPKGDK